MTLRSEHVQTSARIHKEEGSVEKGARNISGAVGGSATSRAPSFPGCGDYSQCRWHLWPTQPASPLHRPEAHSHRLQGDPQTQPFTCRRDHNVSERGGIGPGSPREMLRRVGSQSSLLVPRPTLLPCPMRPQCCLYCGDPWTNHPLLSHHQDTG